VALVVHHAHVFQAHEGPQDFGRVSKDGGALWFLAHT
jgi:hypothetical protein